MEKKKIDKLEKRILFLSWKNGLSHLGSCLTAVNIIDEIYKIKKPDEKFVLSCGHAHLAHLVVREKYEGYKIGKIHDIHCNKEDGCDVSTGSLGMGISISVGMALADRNKNTYVLCSDGETAEGVFWESLRIANELELDNLRIFVNANSYGAYGRINLDLLEVRINLFNPRVKFVRTHLPKWDFITDLQEMHYKQLSKSEYDIIVSDGENKKVSNLRKKNKIISK